MAAVRKDRAAGTARKSTWIAPTPSPRHAMQIRCWSPSGYFEVGDRFKDTDAGRAAIDLSLKFMQKIAQETRAGPAQARQHGRQSLRAVRSTRCGDLPDKCRTESPTPPRRHRRSFRFQKGRKPFAGTQRHEGGIGASRCRGIPSKRHRSSNWANSHPKWTSFLNRTGWCSLTASVDRGRQTAHYALHGRHSSRYANSRTGQGWLLRRDSAIQCEGIGDRPATRNQTRPNHGGQRALGEISTQKAIQSTRFQPGRSWGERDRPWVLDSIT